MNATANQIRRLFPRASEATIRRNQSTSVPVQRDAERESKVRKADLELSESVNLQVKDAQVTAGTDSSFSKSRASSPRPDAPISVTQHTKVVQSKAMNNTERAFQDYMKLRGYDLKWEPITLRLAADLRYTPDFFSESTLTFYEVKGFWRDDARVKIKTAAAMFTKFRFFAVQRKKGQWTFEEFRP